jgi:hypothetical protein
MPVQLTHEFAERQAHQRPDHRVSDGVPQGQRDHDRDRSPEAESNEPPGPGQAGGGAPLAGGICLSGTPADESDGIPSAGPTQTGVTLLEIDRWTLAEELWSFGEDSLYCEPLRMDDEAMIRVWVLAGRPSLRGPARSSGEAAAARGPPRTLALGAPRRAGRDA